MVAATSKPRAETPDVIAMSDVRFVWPGRNAFSLAVNSFALPAAAACRVTEATVEVEIGEHDHDAKADPAAAKNGGHSEFHVQYALECAAPSNITAIEFGYFRAFAGAQKLDVNVITPKGQSKFEVTRSNPNLSLAGMI